jgi:nucleotide-binding universal stress UspA family protein
MKLETVVVPFDFSRHSVRALEQAIELASGQDPCIVLLHVLVLNDRVYPYNLFLTDELVGRSREAAEKALVEWRTRCEAAGLRVEVRVSRGRPWELIPEVAEEVGADLIVMGTRGHTGLKHAVLGSVAERTLARAPCPVLVLRDAEGDPETTSE